jgi:hypothetical protein
LVNIPASLGGLLHLPDAAMVFPKVFLIVQNRKSDPHHSSRSNGKGTVFSLATTWLRLKVF